MKILSKPEELALLAVLKLGKDAYGVNIRKLLIDETGVDWSIGAVYVPLSRMEKAGYLDVFIGKPTAERGGKRSARALLPFRLGGSGSRLMVGSPPA